METKVCDNCGNLCFEPQPCADCESEREFTHHPVSLYCVDCRVKCGSCDRWVCEYHQSGSECRGCHGPSDRMTERMMFSVEDVQQALEHLRNAGRA